MQTDVRRCFGGCCRIVNGQQVSEDDYEKAVLGPSVKMPAIPMVGVNIAPEVLIECRKITGFTKDIEKEAGFYVGTPMYRAFGTMLPVGGMPVVFDAATGQRLREATAEDMARHKEIWNRRAQAEYERNNQLRT